MRANIKFQKPVLDLENVRPAAFIFQPVYKVKKPVVEVTTIKKQKTQKNNPDALF